MTGLASACPACLRRAWLVGRLAGWIELARHKQAALPEILALPDADLIEAVAGPDRAQVVEARAAFDAAAARRRIEAAGLAAVCRHDPAYPQRLLHARDAPAVLYVGGSLERLARLAGEDERPVAIVGARRASRDGLEVAAAIARDLARAGVPVVSGLALGVDSAAQAGALDAGGLSVAVLGGGAEQPYPPSKARLHGRLLADGLVLSELPPGTTPRRWTFPARNRIIAGLAELTVVVEAAERSGSLITADLALRLGRDVAAVPGPVTDSRAAGTNALLRDGAQLVRHGRDVLDALYGVGQAPAVDRTGGEQLEPDLAELLAAVGEGGATIGALAGPSPDRARDVMIRLSVLEARGLVRREPGGRYAVVL